MKKIIVCFLCLLLLSGCSNIFYVKQSQTSNIVNEEKYVKAVWLSYFELSEFTMKNTEEEFKKEISNAFKELKDIGFNTVTVQVRPCADAFYKSDYFPASKYCFGKQGSDMPYDPFKIICETGKSRGLKIEAWINPYRVSQNGKIEELCDANIAKKWYKSNKKKRNVYITDNKIFFNPASKEVQNLIINGVKEIVKNYSIKAIHFDDYFYPTTNKDIDSKEYAEYKKKGGKLTLYDFRRENVNDLIKSVYNAVKSVNKNVLFGVSPAANIKSNYNTLYADTVKWCQQVGYIDYICPQIYFGFKNENQPFMFTTKKWLNISKRDLYIGLPLYKCSKPDEYASSENKEAINEFVNNNNIIARQINYISKLDDIKGIYIFSYSSLKDSKCKKEVENMIKALQNNSQETRRNR